jgi:predicted ArsR family transcriptional regulator
MVDINWECIARVEINATRIAIVDLLQMDGGRTLSPSEIAFELRLRLNNVVYHVNALRESGVIFLVTEWEGGGPTEHFYCLTGHSGKDLFGRAPFDG